MKVFFEVRPDITYADFLELREACIRAIARTNVNVDFLKIKIEECEDQKDCELYSVVTRKYEIVHDENLSKLEMRGGF